MLATSVQLASKYDYLSATFKKCYQWLADHDVNKLENGRYEICDGAFALVQRYTTSAFDKCRFEAHYDYFDIQYLASGVEAFNVCLAEGLKVTEDKKADDVVFFEAPEVYDTVVLKAGQLCVVPPEEAHQPRVAYKDEPCEVVKVVVKVKI